MENDLSQESVAALTREVREQAEEFRRIGAESRMRLLSIQSWLMEFRCLTEHRNAIARIEAAERARMLGPQL